MGAFRKRIENSLNTENIIMTKTLPLPIIDLKPSDPDAVYSALHFAVNESKKLGQSIIYIAFDQQLYAIARYIIETSGDESLKEIFLRLGGFHTLLNFQGVIGKLLGGSGIEEILALVYGTSTISHMLAGHAYARAVRAFNLLYCALMLVLMNEFDFEIENELKEILMNPTKLLNSELLVDINRLVNSKMDEVSDKPTAKLWVMCIRLIDLMNMFIVSERTGDLSLHIFSLTSMLPYFYAAGHQNYSKSVSIYLQDLKKLIIKMSDTELQEFKSRVFTIRRTDSFYSGTWCDMCVEQDFMRSIQTKGGLAGGRGTTHPVIAKWVYSFPLALSVIQALEQLVGAKHIRSEQHKEEGFSRMKRDNDDVVKMYDWLTEHNPFTKTDDCIVNLSSGTKFDLKDVNCHESLEIGKKIMLESIGKDLFTLKLTRKDQARTCLSKTSLIRSSEKTLLIPPQKLMARLVFFSDDDEKLQEIFSHELSNVSLSLFDEGGSLRAPNQNAMFTELEKVTKPTKLTFPVNETNIKIVIDGNFLLQKVKWKKNTSFAIIIQEYANYVLKNFGKAVVVFEDHTEDSEFMSMKPKDSKARQVQCDLQIIPNILQNEFLKSLTNKMNIIKLICKQFLEHQIETVVTPKNHGYNLIQKAIASSDSQQKCFVVGVDAILLILMMFHMPQGSFFLRMGRSCLCYDIEKLISKLSPAIKQHLLTVTAFFGSQLTSAPFNRSRGSFLNVLAKSESVQKYIGCFGEPAKNQEEIKQNALKIFEIIYGEKDKDLSQIRYKNYRKLIQSNSSKDLDLKALPPTKSAAEAHGLRVYFQVLMQAS